MSEFEDTRRLANKILDRPSGDPDDDLAMLSRQLLRADERIASLESRERKLREALEPELIAAVKLLLGASIASCTCNTKSHELLWHDPGCRYVTLSHALERIEQVQAALVDPQGEGKENPNG